MNDVANDPMRFNAWTSKWLPLSTPSRDTTWASPIEVLCGERDGVDLDYPRDDFRVYGRLLLSALVQALFPAKDKAELEARLETPLDRGEVEKTLAPVLGDFDLFGPTPFLQVVRPEKVPDKGAAPFVFVTEDLFRAPTPIEAVSLPIALVMLFIEQTYAGGAGRGYGAGPGGQPGAFTLIDLGSIRKSAWANSLTTALVAHRYAGERARPWSNERRAAVPRASLGLVSGLFFQPRAIWLELEREPGRCSFTGAVGPVVRRSPILPKSELTKKPASGEDLWQHPCAPLAVNSQGIGAVRLNAERPAWTGLAQVLKPVAHGASKGRKSHPAEGPALVLQQWRSLARRDRRPRLLVLDFDRDKANVKRRFFESLPLTERFLGEGDAIERLRSLSDDAQDILRALAKALALAHSERKSDGLALPDAKSTFWAQSEPFFLDWLSATTSAPEDDESADALIDAAEAAMRSKLRDVARRIFDEHVELSEFDARKLELVALARRQLSSALAGKRPDKRTHQTSEVTP